MYKSDNQYLYGRDGENVVLYFLLRINNRTVHINNPVLRSNIETQGEEEDV
jgi:hypothetical protein